MTSNTQEQHSRLNLYHVAATMEWDIQIKLSENGDCREGTNLIELSISQDQVSYWALAIQPQYQQ